MRGKSEHHSEARRSNHPRRRPPDTQSRSLLVRRPYLEFRPHEAALFRTQDDAASTVPILAYFKEIDPWPSHAHPEQWPREDFDYTTR